MLRRFTGLILTTTALSLAVSATAQTTLAELDAENEAVKSVVEVSSPIDYSDHDILMERVTVSKGGRPRVAYDFLRNQDVDFVGNQVSFLASQDISALNENDLSLIHI